MSKYRAHLPQCQTRPGGPLFLTDGGIETTLIFHEGIDLPHFAAFDLLRDLEGREALRAYFARHAAIARRNDVGFILESATWRASPDWAGLLGYTDEALAAVNRDSIDLLLEVRQAFETARSPMVISGCVGPRGDGYDPGELMTADQAQEYHTRQIETFAATEADMISAITMTIVEEAIGITRAAQAADMPVAVSFTVETDGRLPTGQPLKRAIETLDSVTGHGPAYFMINCAHPTHFRGAVAGGETWLDRIRGVRANASTMSHAELDEAEELDSGDPAELTGQYRELQGLLRNLTVVGGCCGTDHRHIEAIHDACGGHAARAA